MLTSVEILKMLKELYIDLGERRANVETSQDEPTFNNGFVLGLSLARAGISKIFMAVDEDNKKAMRLLDAFLREEAEK